MHIEELKGWLTPDQFRQLQQALPKPILPDSRDNLQEAAYRLGVMAALEEVRKRFVREA